MISIQMNVQPCLILEGGDIEEGGDGDGGGEGGGLCRRRGKVEWGELVV